MYHQDRLSPKGPLCHHPCCPLCVDFLSPDGKGESCSGRSVVTVEGTALGLPLCHLHVATSWSLTCDTGLTWLGWTHKEGSDNSGWNTAGDPHLRSPRPQRQSSSPRGGLGPAPTGCRQVPPCESWTASAVTSLRLVPGAPLQRDISSEAPAVVSVTCVLVADLGEDEADFGVCWVLIRITLRFTHLLKHRGEGDVSPKEFVTYGF